MGPVEPTQLALIGPRGGVRPRSSGVRVRADRGDAERPVSNPVARVVIDSSVPHLDRLFDYAVPVGMEAVAEPGVRVRVRLAGRVHDGFIVERAATSDHRGSLRPLLEVVSPIAVLSERSVALARFVADHYAGSLSDVLRLAIPARHAATERAWAVDSKKGRNPELTNESDRPAGDASPEEAGLVAQTSPLAAWSDYPAAASFVEHVREGSAARAVWNCAPSHVWSSELAELISVVAGVESQALAVLPDQRDVAELLAALAGALPPEGICELRADLGPAARYREFLRILRGEVSVVVGTRAAAFAPLRNLRLAVIWDDGDPNHAELRAPYPHVREVLTLRSHLTGCALLVGGYPRTCEAQRLVDAGWAHEIRPDRQAVRGGRPRVTTGAEGHASPDDDVRRMPTAAVGTVREGLRSGPVLVSVARRGYLPVIACSGCRTLALCDLCGDSLSLKRGGSSPTSNSPECGYCGHSEAAWTCRECGGDSLRAVSSGAERTAEELGRMFPGVAVVISFGERRVAEIPDGPALVVATPGAEPRARGGYAAAVLPDARADLVRPDLRASEQAVRRWFGVCSLLRPGAPVTIVADRDDSAVQALIRWDPVGFAVAELNRRDELGLPPAVAAVQVDGSEPDVVSVTESVARVPGVRIRGPRRLGQGEGMPPGQDDEARALLTAPHASLLVAEVRAAVVALSTVHRGRGIRVHVDPPAID